MTSTPSTVAAGASNEARPDNGAGGGAVLAGDQRQQNDQQPSFHESGIQGLFNRQGYACKLKPVRKIDFKFDYTKWSYEVNSVTLFIESVPEIVIGAGELTR